MCLISVEELRGLKQKTLIYFSSEEDDMPYLEDSVKIVVDQGINELVQLLRLIDFETFPIICYDDQDLELASKAFWIIDSFDFDTKVLVQSRGISRSFRPSLNLSLKDSPSHLDISKITNSILYIPQQFSLESPIVPNISKNFSVKVVKKFLNSQKIPTEANGLQLNGQFAEQIALLLRYLGNNVAVLLTQIKSRTKTIASKSNELYNSLAPTEYFDLDEDLRSRKSLYPEIKPAESPAGAGPEAKAEVLNEKSESLEERKSESEHYTQSIELTATNHGKINGKVKRDQNCSCFIL